LKSRRKALREPYALQEKICFVK